MEKKFYYNDGTSNHGPFTLDEMVAKGISRSTKVWHPGLTTWTNAENVQEVNAALSARTTDPPPIVEPRGSSSSGMGVSTSTGQTTTAYSGPPKNWLVESILVTVFCCLPFGIAGIVNASRVNSLYQAGDHAGAQKASEDAKQWTMVGLVLGIIVVLLLTIASLAEDGSF